VFKIEGKRGRGRDEADHVLDVEAFVKEEINGRFPDHKYAFPSCCLLVFG